MKNSNWFASWFDTHYYHILYKDRDYGEAEKFIGKLVSFLNLPNDSYVLDLACGKGRHSITLSEHGYRVLGVDLSEQSISYASQFSHKRLNFKIHDMREKIPNEQFNAIFNLFTSFGYFNKWEDNIRMLESVHSMLVPKGLFLIDFMNIKKVVDNLVEKETKIIDNITFYIQRKIEGHYLFKDIEFEDQEHKHHYTERVQLLDLDSFTELFETTNFELMQVFGDYNLNPLSIDTSNRLILLARKK